MNCGEKKKRAGTNRSGEITADIQSNPISKSRIKLNVTVTLISWSRMLKQEIRSIDLRIKIKKDDMQPGFCSTSVASTLYSTR